MLYARVLRSPHPHARIRVDRRVEGDGAARRQGDPHARELPGRLGRRLDRRRAAIQRRDQEDHEAAPLRVQQPGAVRRRAGRGGRRRRPPRRRRGARADRCRIRAAAVRARSGGGARSRARRRSGPRATSSLNNRNEAQPIGAAPRQRRRRAEATSAHVFEDRYTTAFVHNAQMEPRACVARVGRRQADRLHADRRHRQLPARHRARSRHARTTRSASSASTWAATSATRTRTRTPI